MISDKDHAYMNHILECVALIQHYTRNGKADFLSNSLIQDVVLRRLQTITESTQRLSEELKIETPAINWRALAGFRNILVHDYLGGIDLEQVWNAVEHSLPELETAVQNLMTDMTAPTATQPQRPTFGFMQDTGTIIGDIIAPASK